MEERMCTYLGVVSEKARQRGSMNSRKAFAKIWKVFFNKVLPRPACIYPKPGWKLSGQPRHCPDNNINSIKFWGKF